MLRITNHHGDKCGAPPQIEERPDRYLGYFENSFGEQWVYVHDKDQPTGRLHGGDASWKEYTVKDGSALGLILDQEEMLWLQACWTAAVASMLPPAELPF